MRFTHAHIQPARPEAPPPAGEPVTAWRLTAAISPRRVVRAATTDATGQALNCYPLVHPVSGSQPVTPWAVHLTDPQHRFRLLCFDLDARPAPQTAERDCALLSHLLTASSIEHVVCASGPTGGRHVWIALAEPIDASLVADLAHLLKAWLPSLDTAPLVNPKTGSARPPGAPHRLGGTSQVLSGSLTSLIGPRVATRDVETLLRVLATKATTAMLARQPDTPTMSVVVTGGRPHLTGARRELSALHRSLLDAPPAGDSSAVLWRILCAAVAARWQFADVLGLLDRPGLEHARTLNTAGRRLARPVSGPSSPREVLRRQWDRAVTSVSRMPPTRPVVDEGDPTFDARAGAVADLVDAVQRRADLAPGRWRGRRGLAQRRVLDVLCLFHLHAVRSEVEADVRRIALTGGLDRETARRALLALADDGWIRRTRPAIGTRAAIWTIDPHASIHTPTTRALSQGNPRPPTTGAALRAAATNHLTDRLQAAAHDVFAPTGGLGLEAGSAYSRLTEPHTTIALAQSMGWDGATTEHHLHRLAAVGLVTRLCDGWTRTGEQHRDEAASQLGTSGRNQQRAELYQLERALWAWWLAEHAWMCSPRRLPATANTLAKPRPDPPTTCRHHPRNRRHRADYAAARRHLTSEDAPRPPVGQLPRVEQSRRSRLDVALAPGSRLTKGQLPQQRHLGHRRQALDGNETAREVALL